MVISCLIKEIYMSETHTFGLRAAEVGAGRGRVHGAPSYMHGLKY